MILTRISEKEEQTRNNVYVNARNGMEVSLLQGDCQTMTFSN